MTVQDLGAIGELIGSIAVLATLAYLTVQTRQNTRAIQAQAENSRVTNTIQNLLTSATSKELPEAWFDGEDSQRAMRRRNHALSVFTAWEWELRQRRSGVLISRDASPVVAVFRRYPGMEALWDAHASDFPAEFVGWIEEQRAKAA